MADAWPASLPDYWQMDGYSDAMGDNRLISPMETGPAKVRPRSTAAPRPLRGRMIMDGDQLADLRDFVQATLIGGSLPFEMPDPIDGSTMLVRFAGSLPSWSPLGADNYSVTLDLEVLP